MPYRRRDFRKGGLLKFIDLQAMDAEIARLGRITISGGLTLHDGPNGLAWGVTSLGGGVMSAVAATGGITAASGNTLGSGDATLRIRSGADLTDGPTVKVYSNMTVVIAAATRLVIAPDGDAFQLVTAMCP